MCMNVMSAYYDEVDLDRVEAFIDEVAVPHVAVKRKFPGIQPTNNHFSFSVFVSVKALRQGNIRPELFYRTLHRSAQPVLQKC